MSQSTPQEVEKALRLSLPKLKKDLPPAWQIEDAMIEFQSKEEDQMSYLERLVLN